MKIRDINHARQQVYKIMRDMGKEPATFKDQPPPSGRRLSREQLLGLGLLLLMFLMVWGSLIIIFWDWWQK